MKSLLSEGLFSHAERENLRAPASLVARCALVEPINQRADEDDATRNRQEDEQEILHIYYSAGKNWIVAA